MVDLQEGRWTLCRMAYDADAMEYRLTTRLKQGWVDYQYVIPQAEQQTSGLKAATARPPTGTTVGYAPRRMADRIIGRALDFN